MLRIPRGKKIPQGVERSEAKHAGLNMLEELAWVKSFLAKGTYAVNWGQRYFAELVNPIPRGLWPDKPSSESTTLWRVGKEWRKGSV